MTFTLYVCAFLFWFALDHALEKKLIFPASLFLMKHLESGLVFTAAVMMSMARLGIELASSLAIFPLSPVSILYPLIYAIDVLRMIYGIQTARRELNHTPWEKFLFLPRAYLIGNVLFAGVYALLYL